jgi:hypothetical protein
VSIVIRPYVERDERGWLRCRVLSFLDTAFFDSVEREKERYEKPAIELVAEDGREIIGLLDLECDSDGLADRPGRGGMIWHLAGTSRSATPGSCIVAVGGRRTSGARRAGSFGLKHGHVTMRTSSAGTSATGFTQIDSYLHVYLERDDLRAFDGELRLVKAFAHYTGDEPAKIRQRYLRVHNDVLYEKRL